MNQSYYNPPYVINRGVEPQPKYHQSSSYPQYHPRSSWRAWDYYRAHTRYPNTELFYAVLHLAQENLGKGGVSPTDAREAHGRVYNRPLLRHLPPSELGAAAAYETYHDWKYYHSFIYGPLHGERMLEREVFIALAIAEATNLWHLSNAGGHRQSLQNCLEAAAMTASRIAYNNIISSYATAGDHHHERYPSSGFRIQEPDYVGLNAYGQMYGRSMGDSHLSNRRHSSALPTRPDIPIPAGPLYRAAPAPPIPMRTVNAPRNYSSVGHQQGRVYAQPAYEYEVGHAGMVMREHRHEDGDRYDDYHKHGAHVKYAGDAHEGKSGHSRHVYQIDKPGEYIVSRSSKGGTIPISAPPGSTIVIEARHHSKSKKQSSSPHRHRDQRRD